MTQKHAAMYMVFRKKNICFCIFQNMHIYIKIAANACEEL